jgi:hypothetical protein
MLLQGATDKLQVVTSAVCTVSVHASCFDLDPSQPVNDRVTTHRDNTNIVSAATTDVVSPPGGALSRRVDELYVSNTHAANPVDVSILHTDGTTVVELEKATLLAGERISYVRGKGFRVFDVNGAEKTQISPIFLVKKSLADHANATTTVTEVTDLSLGCGVGTWTFEYWIRFWSSLSTTGPKLSVNFDGTVTVFPNTLYAVVADVTGSAFPMDQDVLVPGVMVGMAKRVKDATGTMIGTGGVDTINADVLLLITGIAVVTVAGNFELWHGSETANNTIVKQDSVLRLCKIG